jgi:tRNA (guanine37-N1)-methyltransferase
MKISILTLFPDIFRGCFDLSIIKRAQTQKIISIDYYNIRDYATDKYRTVDDHPYGGGAGMILRVDIVDRCLQQVLVNNKNYNRTETQIILMDPGGEPYTQKIAAQLKDISHLILICGHYEGVDERIRSLVDREISI